MGLADKEGNTQQPAARNKRMQQPNQPSGQRPGLIAEETGTGAPLRFTDADVSVLVVRSVAALEVMMGEDGAPLALDADL